MKTILVSGASGVVGYGCLKSIRCSGEEYRLIGTSIHDDSVAPKYCDVFEQAPVTSSKNYIGWLIGIIEKHKVDLIIPCIEIDMFAWAANMEVLAKTRTKILLNNVDLINLCHDKWQFYTVLKNKAEEYAIPSEIDGDFIELSNQFKLPFLLKPRRGYASKGIIKISEERQFLYVKEISGTPMLAQPIIGNDENEYTTSAFFDNRSNLCAHMTLRRKLSEQGYTEKAQVVQLLGVEQAITKLAQIFKPVGPTNFQFREESGELKLLEINPRISSATSIRTAFGYNESMMSINYFLHDIIPKQPSIKSGAAVRYLEDYIVYDRHNL